MDIEIQPRPDAVGHIHKETPTDFGWIVVVPERAGYPRVLRTFAGHHKSGPYQGARTASTTFLTSLKIGDAIINMQGS
jgi:hypothetical protein